MLDDATGWCIGCGRTLDEIADWGGAGPDDKRTILAMLPGRLDRLTRE